METDQAEGGSFEGDAANTELRERMALALNLPSEPLVRDEGGSVFGMVGQLAGLVTIAAIATYGFVWISTPRGQPIHDGFAPAAYEKPVAGEEPGAAPALNSAGVNAASSNSGGFKPGGGARLSRR